MSDSIALKRSTTLGTLPVAPEIASINRSLEKRDSYLSRNLDFRCSRVSLWSTFKRPIEVETESKSALFIGLRLL